MVALATGLLLNIGGTSPAFGAEFPKKPNIILIVADDLGYGEVGCYGQTKIQTPTLDRMAKEGMRFTQFYAGAPLCASSRNVLLTGEHTGHCRVRENGRPNIQTLRLPDVTIAEKLKEAGYNTAIIGKWAIGGDDPSTGGRPEDQGFDYFYGYLNSVHAHNYYPEYLWRNRKKVMLGNVVQEVPPGYAGFVGGMATTKKAYSLDLFVEESLGWIRKQQPKDQPFFLLMTPTIPHANPEARKLTGNGAEVPSHGIYAEKDWTEQNKGQAAMITRLDDGIGQILSLLKELKIDDETLVMVTSDNGPHNEAGHDPEFFDANGPLRGTKFTLFEGGIRVPTIARMPGVIASGEVTDQLGYFGDFMATFCDMTGAALPSPPHGLDSLSLVPTLTGDVKNQQQPKYLYFEISGSRGRHAIRFGKWKAIRSPLGFGKTQLYDLESDLAEQNDLAATHSEVVRQAEHLMDEAHIESKLWPDPKPPKQ